MRLADAQNLIDVEGYRVEFERQDGILLKSDRFPGRDEPPFTTAEEAFHMAEAFAAKVPRVVNVRVYGLHGCKVVGEFDRTLNRYPE